MGWVGGWAVGGGWNKLLRASVVPGEDGFLRIPRPQSAELHSGVSEDLALFAVDFSAMAPTRRHPTWAPPCGREALFRGRPLLGSLHDQAERARIHQELNAVNLALNPVPSPPPSPASPSPRCGNPPGVTRP